MSSVFWGAGGGGRVWNYAFLDTPKMIQSKQGSGPSSNPWKVLPSSLPPGMGGGGEERKNVSPPPSPQTSGEKRNGTWKKSKTASSLPFPAFCPGQKKTLVPARSFTHLLFLYLQNCLRIRSPDTRHKKKRLGLRRNPSSSRSPPWQ